MLITVNFSKLGPWCNLIQPLSHIMACRSRRVEEPSLSIKFNNKSKLFTITFKLTWKSSECSEQLLLSTRQSSEVRKTTTILEICRPRPASLPLSSRMRWVGIRIWSKAWPSLVCAPLFVGFFKRDYLHVYCKAKPGSLTLDELDRFRYVEAPARFSKKTGRTMELVDIQKLVEWKM